MGAHESLRFRLLESIRHFSRAKNLTPRQAIFALALLIVIWTVFLWSSLPYYPPASALRLGRLQHYGTDGVPEVRALTANSRVAFATFLAENTKRTGDTEKDNDDMYFVATRVLAYQLLHDPETRTNNSTPFIVLVTSAVSESKRRTLESDGATVIFAEDVPLPFWVKTGVTRWKDQFTKLRLFELVEYERIVFIDADTLLTRNMDGIFEDPAVKFPSETLLESKRGELKSDEAVLPENVMNRWRRFNPHTMEQSLLNYAHRLSGTMPWGRLDYKWSATWPNHADLKGGVASLHEKFWSAGEEDMRRLWYDMRTKMERYWSNQG
ncbi:hypothetical protein TWF970_002171 [Orbilia oligospora]|uniref:Uncharacterized protein n=1 Tax=Orbilia oligospora TaxID=2813651 RepID=A0A7C8REV9_ORBOL|nr:hypothetical protein TWF970_002171 [Orbilia oligospora]